MRLRKLYPVVGKLTFMLLLGGAPATIARSAMDAAWVEKWEEDLEVAHDALLAKHPNPFDHISVEEMQVEFDRLIERLPEMGHAEVIVGLTRIVARVGDGHTRLTLPLAPGVEFMQGHSETERPALPAMEFRQYPLRLGVDAVGQVWVQGASREHRRLVGSRLIAIDNRTTAEAIELVSSTIRRDNPMQVLHHLPMHLVLAELLYAVDVTKAADQAIFTFDKWDGSMEEIALLAAPDGATIDWVEAGPTDADALPLARQRNEENFWFNHLESQGLVYLQFNTVYDKDEETIREFSDRLLAVLSETPEAALVIDLRHNRGGNQALGLPLLHAVIASPQNRAGQLFTITGRTTFSAAMTFSLQMEKHTQTLFVGEPTGSKPNHYGDSRKTLLPNSNVTLRISSLYWQWSPTDARPWIAPHADAPPTLEAELAGEDPALALIESVMAGGLLAADLDGEWRGNLPPASYGRDSVFRLEDSRDSAPATPSESPQATVDVPLFGLESGATEDLKVDSDRISFEIPVGEETVSYQGRINDRWIVGHGDLGSIRFPVLLERAID